MARKPQITEDDLMKALGNLEEEAANVEEEEGEEVEEQEETEKKVAKGNIPDQMRSTKKANGGFSGKGGAGKDGSSDISTEADEKDPSLHKSDEDEEEIEEGADMEEEEADDEEEEAPVHKSTRDALRADDNIRKGLEISPFLESLTEVLGEQMDGITKSVSEFQGEQTEFNAKLQKAMVVMGKLVGQIAAKVDAFENAPARPRKSALTKSEVSERFDTEGAPQFSKSQVLSHMMDMVEKGELPAVVVSTYESTDYIDPAHADRIAKSLTSTKAG